MTTMVVIIILKMIERDGNPPATLPLPSEAPPTSLVNHIYNPYPQNSKKWCPNIENMSKLIGWQTRDI